MRCGLLILLLLNCGGAVFAQQPEDKTANDAIQAVLDDDGGRAFIVNSKLKSLNELRRLPVKSLAAPQQYSIFLGGLWSTPELRARESKLNNLLSSIRNQNDVNKLNNLGVSDLYGPTDSQEVLTEFTSDERISDISIRTILSGLVNDGVILKPERSTIYVIFLQPDVRSTLGTLTGRKHYLAYHQFVNTGGQRLHYVVVPYESDLDTARAIALSALIAAAQNPNGEIGK